MKGIVFTGGGSAGHVVPNLALLPYLHERGWKASYIGSYKGIEREVVGDRLPYYPISSGKLRRYFALQNFTDPFRVMRGLCQALGILRTIKPQVIFSKGGFVSLPVALAGRMLGIPVILHESDYSPGLANRLALPFASHICVSFPETAKALGRDNVSLTGNPIRRELSLGSKEEGRKIAGFSLEKPVLLVIGGSLGSKVLNHHVRQGLPKLLKDYQVIHLCGKGNLDARVSLLGYRQFEYVGEELPHFFALADLVVSRAGANSLFELLYLKKPHLLIPLSLQASRGDQIQNAKSFAACGMSELLLEEDVTETTLLAAIESTYAKRDSYIRAMEDSAIQDGTKRILDILETYSKKA